MAIKSTFTQFAQKLIENTEEANQLKEAMLTDKALLTIFEKVTKVCIQAYRNNKRIFFCGNGGSAADAQHIAAELSGRFNYNRPPLYSDALHVNTSYITSVANDYGYDEVYARLVKAFCQKGDILFCLTTSGNSKNILNAAKVARKMGTITVGMTGQQGGKLKPHADYLLKVPSKKTARIQEVHMLFGHTLCENIEAILFPRKK